MTTLIKTIEYYRDEFGNEFTIKRGPLGTFATSISNEFGVIIVNCNVQQNKISYEDV